MSQAITCIFCRRRTPDMVVWDMEFGQSWTITLTVAPPCISFDTFARGEHAVWSKPEPGPDREPLAKALGDVRRLHRIPTDAEVLEIMGRYFDSVPEFVGQA